MDTKFETIPDIMTVVNNEIMPCTKCSCQKAMLNDGDINWIGMMRVKMRKILKLNFMYENNQTDFRLKI